MTFPLVDRSGARVLLVDSAGRVLLLRGADPADPADPGWWLTPGGGLEPGESARDAAARELAEETGFRVPPADLGEPVHAEIVEFTFNGAAYRQDQVFYLVRVTEWVMDITGWTDLERRYISEHRWWTAAEIATTAETVYPDGLADLLTGLLAATSEGA